MIETVDLSYRFQNYGPYKYLDREEMDYRYKIVAQKIDFTNKHIVDLNCGNGRLSKYAKNFWTYKGCDINRTESWIAQIPDDIFVQSIKECDVLTIFGYVGGLVSDKESQTVDNSIKFLLNKFKPEFFVFESIEPYYRALDILMQDFKDYKEFFCEKTPKSQLSCERVLTIMRKKGDWDLIEEIKAKSQGKRKAGEGFWEYYLRRSQEVVSRFSYPKVLKTDSDNELRNTPIDGGIAKNLLADVTCLELNPQVCIQAKNKGFNVVQGDIRNLTFPNQSFEVLIDCSTLDHISPDFLPKTLQGYKRVLKPKGICLLFVWATDNKEAQNYQKTWNINHDQYFLTIQN